MAVIWLAPLRIREALMGRSILQPRTSAMAGRSGRQCSKRTKGKSLTSL
jgi:hypothetical protein